MIGTDSYTQNNITLRLLLHHTRTERERELNSEPLIHPWGQMAKGNRKVRPSTCISHHEVCVNNSQTFSLGKLYSAAYFRLRGVLTNTTVPPPFSSGLSDGSCPHPPTPSIGRRVSGPHRQFRWSTREGKLDERGGEGGNHDLEQC